MNLGISIIIPVFNTKIKDFERCLKSIEVAFSMKSMPHEIVIVDDGSRISYDETIELFSRKLNIKYLKKKLNAGRSNARNVGIDICFYEWVSFLDSDDELLPNYFEVVFEQLSSQFALIYDFFTFSYLLNSIPVFRPISLLSLSPVKFDKYHYFCTNTIVIKKAIFNNFRFDEKMSFGEDIHLWRTILVFFSGTHLNRIVSKYNYDFKSHGSEVTYSITKIIFKQIKYYLIFYCYGQIFRYSKQSKCY